VSKLGGDYVGLVAGGPSGFGLSVRATDAGGRARRSRGGGGAGAGAPAAWEGRPAGGGGWRPLRVGDEVEATIVEVTVSGAARTLGLRGGGIVPLLGVDGARAGAGAARSGAGAGDGREKESKVGKRARDGDGDGDPPKKLKKEKREREKG